MTKPLDPRPWHLRAVDKLLRIGLTAGFLICYRSKTYGKKELWPKTGGALVVSNHISYLDVIYVNYVSPRRLRFLGFEGFLRVPVLGWFFRTMDVIPVSPAKAKDGIVRASEACAAGSYVVIFPEGQISRSGALLGVQRGFALIARKANVPVLPVYLDGLYGSIFSFSGGRYFKKWPRRFPYPLRAVYGAPIDPHDTLAMSRLRETLSELGEEAFRQRPELNDNLARRLVGGLKSAFTRELLVDHTADRVSLTGGKLLAAALALGSRWKTSIPGQRIGLVLPTGRAATIANLAALIAGKTPVNFNFTLGRAAIESSLRTSDVTTVISAQAMREKLPEFPFPADTRDFKAEIDAIAPSELKKNYLLAKFLPTGILCNLAGIPAEGGDREATILFSSGSTGEPKGVVLSHRNLLANLIQVDDTALFRGGHTILASLPVFHSFGFTVTVCLPMAFAVRVVTVPSPLDFKKIAKAIQEEKATALLGTPTFMRPYLTRTEPEAFASLRYVIAGAEKTPAGFAEAWEKRFPNCLYLEGYGLTETSPVASFNLPDPAVTTSTAEVQPARRSGSVGRLVSGMAARIVDPDTGELLPQGKTGILQLRGSNVFQGYLNDPARTAEVIRDGWYVTGDLARFDEDGFLFIEGRLSRFSKIGGEMVPHGTIETVIAKACGVDTADKPAVAVSSISDPSKGEALVLLTTFPLAGEELRNKLEGSGLVNLWIPRIIHQVETIPVLPTGKLDLKGLKKLAEEKCARA